MERLRQVVEEVLIELFPYAEAKAVIIRPNLNDIEPMSVNRHFAGQILANIIHNAIKYSPQGGVVDVTLDLQIDNVGQEKVVYVEVKDRGKGIEEKDRERIFELRIRGDALIESGSGLGLHYARKLAHLHGGNVMLVESAVNHGSTFRIILPYR